MKCSPILFSGDLVRAILDGRKTQTRRPMKTQPDGDLVGATAMHSGDEIDGLWWDERTLESEDGPKGFRCPFGGIGDRLWVRETIRVDGWNDVGRASVTYLADDEHAVLLVDVPDYDVWVERQCKRLVRAGAQVTADGDLLVMPAGKPAPATPSIHMPRWASRITLEITDVRVQRLMSISDDDAAAEGVLRAAECRKGFGALAFARRWDQAYGEGAAAGNPWVWAITFKRVGGAS